MNDAELDEENIPIFWGPHEPYERLYVSFLRKLNGYPLANESFWSRERDAQLVRIKVRALTGVRLDEWDEMTPPERIPWLEAAYDELMRLKAADEEGRHPQCDRPVGVVSQEDAALLLGMFSTQVSRRIGKGLVALRGAGGRVWITLESLEEYRRQRKKN